MREPPAWVFEFRATFERMLREGDEQTIPQVLVMPHSGQGGTMMALAVPKSMWRASIARTIAQVGATDVLFVNSMWVSKASSPEKEKAMRERTLTPEMDPEHEHVLGAVWKSRDGSFRYWTLGYELDSKSRAVNVEPAWTEVQILRFAHLEGVFEAADLATRILDRVHELRRRG